MKLAPTGPEPRNVDAAYEAYEKLKDESMEICKRLLRKCRELHFLYDVGELHYYLQ